MKTFITTATIPHVSFISKNMRADDLMELKAVGKINPYQALMAGYLSSRPFCYCGMMDSTPFTLFGVVPVSRNPDIGSIWLLGTDVLTEKVPISFLRWSKKFLPEMIEPYDMVCNMVHEKNVVHVKWLKWLGFKFIRKIIYGPSNETFLEFARLNHV